MSDFGRLCSIVGQSNRMTIERNGLESRHSRRRLFFYKTILNSLYYLVLLPVNLLFRTLFVDQKY